MILGQAFVPSRFAQPPMMVVIRAHTVTEAEHQAEAQGATLFWFAGERYQKLGAEWVCES